MKKITEYSVNKFPSNIELFLYYAGGRLNMHLDLGILINSKATIEAFNAVGLRIKKIYSMEFSKC